MKLYHIAILFLTIHISYREVASWYNYDRAKSVICYCCAHRSFCWFSHAAAQLILFPCPKIKILVIPQNILGLCSLVPLYKMLLFLCSPKPFRGIDFCDKITGTGYSTEKFWTIIIPNIYQIHRSVLNLYSVYSELCHTNWHHSHRPCFNDVIGCNIIFAHNKHKKYMKTPVLQ